MGFAPDRIHYDRAGAVEYASLIQTVRSFWQAASSLQIVRLAPLPDRGEIVAPQ
jgi:hypothetical protein